MHPTDASICSRANPVAARHHQRTLFYSLRAVFFVIEISILAKNHKSSSPTGGGGERDLEI